MKTLDRYLIRTFALPLAATTVIALLAMLLERMLRVMEVTANVERSLLIVVQLLVNLVPYYMSVALPAAFFVAVVLAFNRLSSDSELIALNALGIGLTRLAAPVMATAVVLTLASVLIVGYLQPYGRYAYRALMHVVSRASIGAALHEGAILHGAGLTLTADRVSRDGRGLGAVFVDAERDDGSEVVTTARSGALSRAEEKGGRPVLRLRDGARVTIAPDGTLAGVVSFEAFNWPLDARVDRPFRPRGRDSNELTLDELVARVDALGNSAAAAPVRADLHARLVRILTTLVLPLLGIPLGLGGGRHQRANGIAFGLVILVAYQKILIAGEALVAVGSAPPWLALWVPFTLLAIGSGWLFARVRNRVTAAPSFAFVERVVARLAGGRRRWSSG